MELLQKTNISPVCKFLSTFFPWQLGFYEKHTRSDARQEGLIQYSPVLHMCNVAFHLGQLQRTLIYCSIFGCRANPFLSVSLELTSANRASTGLTLLWLEWLTAALTAFEVLRSDRQLHTPGALAVPTTLSQIQRHIRRSCAQRQHVAAQVCFCLMTCCHHGLFLLKLSYCSALCCTHRPC